MSNNPTAFGVLFYGAIKAKGMSANGFAHWRRWLSTCLSE